MLSGKSFLSLDFGAGSLKLAEFDLHESGALILKNYGVRPLGLEGSQDSTREPMLRKAITELLAEKQVRARKTNVCAPGFHVFSKFVKLPPVDSAKVTQIIQYEAQQNVPFPLAEVVWDYQILGALPSGELEVLLVAIKADVVEGLFRTAEGTGLKLQLVDASQAAICNAFRYNYSDLEGCVMLLDIGAKTSNLLFFEKGKMYARGINIGANSITQEFAAEAKLRFGEAEKIKVAEGFVGLGGAYEEPDNAHQAAISKIARQVMTRLHIQVNQTLQFYRGQQGGSAPTQLFLAGGASIMPYTSQFFAEKLNIPVEYFNPFRNVQIDPSVNVEELAKVAHSFGEVVGAGLRNAAQCPVELNLVPKSILKRQQFDQRKPYFIASIFCLVLVVAAWALFYARVAAVKSAELEKTKEEVQPLAAKETELKRVETAIKSTKGELDTVTGLLDERLYWADLLGDINHRLADVEKNFTRPAGLDVGVWIESIAEGTGIDASGGAIEPQAPMAAPEAAGGSPTMALNAAAPAAKGGPVNNRVLATFHSVDLSGQGIANSDLVYAVTDALKKSPFLLVDGTELSGNTTKPDNNEPVFQFSVLLALKHPIIR